MDAFEPTSRRGLAVAFALSLLLGLVLARPARHPAKGRVVVTDCETTVLDVVEFVPNQAVIQPSSRPILDAVAATLVGNPSIELVEVQSHTSGIGDAIENQKLSEARAATIVSYLVAAGVDASRLVPAGYGDTQPIERGAPAKNERVSFLILRRSTDVVDP